MKKIYSILAFFAAMTVIAACNKDIEPVQVPEQNPAGLSGPVTISASIPDGGLTRVSLEQDTDPDGKIKLAWEDTDKIVVKNAADESKSVTFTLKEGAGSKSAKFTAADDSALDGATAYKIELSSNLPGDYNIQTQAADASTAHLGYSAVLSGVNKYDSVTFSKEWAAANGSGTFASSAILRLRAKMPSHDIANNVQKVTLKSNKDLFDGDKKLEIGITSPGVSGDVVTVYASLPAEDVTVSDETTLLVQFQTSADATDKYTAYRELGGMSLSAGKVNAINLSCVNVDKYANDTEVNIGTQYNPYFIGDKHQMLAMHGEMVEGSITYFKMVDDVDLNGINWESLNNDSPYTKSINFDGGGYTISNLNSNGETTDYPSFVGVLQGDINNVIFDGATIECDSKKGGVVAGYFGHKSNGVTGNARKVIVRNSSVNAKERAGAFAGEGNNVGVISQCRVENTSIVSTTARVGGFLGTVVLFDEMSDCVAEKVTVSSTGSYYVGGFIGQLDDNGKVLRCHSSGLVSSGYKYSRSGGVVGIVLSGTVEDCDSECTVKVTGQFGGGVVGDVKNSATIRKCHFSGEVISENHYSGGILGIIESGGTATIEKCWFDGRITLPSDKAQAGAIVSLVDKNGASVSISDCYSTGSISARRWCGGIIGGVEGTATSVSIKNCYTTTSIPNGANGALIGRNDLATENVTCSGFIGWWDGGNLIATGNDVTPTSYYIGTEGTILSHAQTFGWDFTNVWTTDATPKLR